MRLRKDIRVHPQRDPREFAQLRRALRQQIQFLLALHVEQQDVRTQRQVHLFRCLADPGKDGALHRAFIGPPHPLQLAAGDDIEARALARNHS